MDVATESPVLVLQYDLQFLMPAFIIRPAHAGCHAWAVRSERQHNYSRSCTAVNLPCTNASRMGPSQMESIATSQAGSESCMVVLRLQRISACSSASWRHGLIGTHLAGIAWARSFRRRGDLCRHPLCRHAQPLSMRGSRCSELLASMRLDL